MSKAARGIPGQRVMSRLLARVASRPAIGPSPAFFARFGLDDPWAGIGSSGGEDSRDPLFVFLSAEGYYRDVARMRAARQRLMARFAALEAGPVPAVEIFGRRMPDLAKPRVSAMASAAMSSPILLAAAPVPEPESEETAGRWIERRREPRERPVRKAASERAIGRALRREGPSADQTIVTALRDAGVSLAGATARRALASALGEVRTLSGEGQAEVARRVVRSIRGPSRHAARVAVEEMVETNESRPLQVALSRQPGSRSRKGLRPVLSASPALVALQHEEPKPVEKAPEPRARRAAAPAAPVVRQSAHRETPVAMVAREVRTQRVTGRAGPAAIEASSSEDVPAAAPRRRPTERVARRTQALGTLPTSIDTRRGFAATESAVADPVKAAVGRAVARSVEPVALGGEARLSRSPVAYAREIRRSRSISSPVAPTFVAAPEPVSTEAVPALSRRAAPVTRASLPATASAPTVRAAARSAEPVVREAARRSSLVSAAPTAYVAAQPAEADPISAPATRRGVQRAIARSVPVARADERGAPMLSQSPVAHARPARRRPVGIAPAAPAAAEIAQSVAATPARAGRRARAVEAAPAGVARRVFQRVLPRAEARRSESAEAVAVVAPVETTPTARAALRAAPVVSRDSRGARRLAAAPTDYVHLSHPEPEVADAATPPARRSARPAVRLAAREAQAAVPAVAPAAEPRSSTARAARRAAPVAAAPAARRGVLAPVPTAYAAAPEAAGLPEAIAAEPERSRATARAAARADAPIAVDERGAGLITRSVTAYARPERASRRPLSASPVARFLEPAQAGSESEVAGPAPRAARSVVERAARPSAVAARPGIAARAEVVADEVRASRRVVATRRVADRMLAVAPEAADPVRADRRTAESVPARSMGAAGRALARAAGASPEISDADVMRAAVGVVRERAARRRAVRPAMPHALASSEFRWALPVVAAAEAEVGAVRTREGAAAGPVTRENLSGVLRRVASAVRALERSDRTSLVTEGPRRAVAEESSREGIAPRAEIGRAPAARRAIRRTADGVLVLAPVADAEVAAIPGAAPRRAVAGRASAPVAWAERRAAVAPASVAAPTLLSAAAPAAHAAPGVRLVRRAFAGAEGLPASAGVDRAVARTLSPVAARAEGGARLRTQRTAEGTFAPLARAEAPARAAFGLGAPGIPSRRRPRVDAATGMVLPEPHAPVAEAAPAAPAARRRAGAPEAAPVGTTASRRVEGPARRADAPRRAAAPAAEVGAVAHSEPRPWFGTLGELASRADSAGPSRRRRPSRLAVDATSGAVFASAAPAPAEVDELEASRPAWAKRAIEGSLALPPVAREAAGKQPMASRVGASSSVLVALSRADHPEEVVRVILERSAQLRTLAAELPGQAGEMVGRLVDVGEREGAARASAVAGVAPEQRLLSAAPEASAHTTGSRSRRRSTYTAGSTQSDMGATKVTKLASKLMNLIHLAEAERKRDQDKVAYRMAADTSEARAESAGPSGEKSPTENVNMKALQRDVLEAVLRELELTQQRRQEDPDGRSIWW